MTTAKSDATTIDTDTMFSTRRLFENSWWTRPG